GADLLIVSETNIDAIIQSIEEIRPRAVIIDSIQIMYSETLESAPGSVGQLKEITNRFMRLAKEKSVTVFLVGHITKEGTIAGPKTIEHIVDTVLYFEGERYQNCRILRSVKNRFGATDEIGVFSMTEAGLAEVKNPSEIFLAERHEEVPGSIVVPSIEGTRPILVEIQALVSPAVYGTPNRKALGVDYNRMVLLLAVLEKRVGLGLHSKDVFINVAGGARISEPAADLGIVMAVFSSYKDRPVDKGTVAIGEVGLGGEIRSVTNIEKRIREGAKLGFDRFIVPKYSLKNIGKERSFDKLNLCGADNVRDALKIISNR
ncbi:DNA repair protein RadA, partial [Candidatus Auribacterota bacterium]